MSVSTLNRILTDEISLESNFMSPQITEGEDTAVSVAAVFPEDARKGSVIRGNKV
jgi:hypothetical protein